MIKDILAKIKNKEALTDEETAELLEYDYDKDMGSTAAGARRKAEQEAAKLKARLAEIEAEREALESKSNQTEEAKLSAEQKFQKQVELLSKQVEQFKREKEESEAKIKANERKSYISKLRDKHGISFVKGIDSEVISDIFERQFNGLESFDDEDEVTGRINSFVEKNKAIILDKSGSGSGDGEDGKPSVGGGSGNSKIEKMSDEELSEYLKNAGKGKIRIGAR